MAIIPRAKPATQVPAGPQGVQAPRIQVDAATRDLANTLGALATNMIEQRRTNEVARKKIEIFKRLGRLESDISLGNFRADETGFSRADTPGGDFSVAPQAFEQLSGGLREEILADIDDNVVREQVSNAFDMAQAQKTATVRNAAVKQMRDATVAELDVNTEEFGRAFVNATTDNERLDIAQAFRDQLVQATTTGAITREDMVKRAQDFRNEVAELEVRKDLLGATKSVDLTERVLNKLRDPREYSGLTPDARQGFEEQALRQFHASVNFQFQMELRQERLAALRLKQAQQTRTQELSELIRPVDEFGMEGEPQIGHVEIERAFQLGQISAPQANYLRARLERPSPDPDPITRFSYVGRFTEEAYAGTLDPDDVYIARAAGFIRDEDATGLINLSASRTASGGPIATTDAKQALEFVTSYMFGVKSIFNVQLTDDKIRRLGAVELLFNGRVSRGENPYSVAAELIEEDSRAEISVTDVPPQVQDMFSEAIANKNLKDFWGPAKEKLEQDDSLTLTQRHSLVQSLELLQRKKGKELNRLPQVLEELRIRAENFDRRQQ